MLFLSPESKAGLEILVRRNALTPKDWFDLLETRRALIARHSKEISLGTLGEARVAQDYFGCHPINVCRQKLLESKAVLGDSKFSLDTQVILPRERGMITEHHAYFYDSDESLARAAAKLPADKPSKRIFWGLTRGGEWIVVEVFVELRREQYKYYDRFETRANVDRVIILETTPQTMCEKVHCTPTQIWHRLGDFIQGWSEGRKQLYEQAKRFADLVDYENTLAQILEPNNI